MARSQAILNFWFGDPTDPSSEYGQPRRIWFKKNPDFDAAIRQQFYADYERAAAGQLDAWKQQPQSCLALILLLDQFPRNMFRGTARSFATDPQALAVAQHAIAQGHDQSLMPVARQFVYLPFEHSEDLHHQGQAVAYFEALVQQAPELHSALDYAYRHRDVIARFGRFPHRNEILGRETTPAEAEFLAQPGARF